VPRKPEYDFFDSDGLYKIYNKDIRNHIIAVCENVFDTMIVIKALNHVDVNVSTYSDDEIDDEINAAVDAAVKEAKEEADITADERSADSYEKGFDEGKAKGSEEAHEEARSLIFDPS